MFRLPDENPLKMTYTLLCIMSVCTVSGSSTPPRQYTINTNRLTWNEAKAVCADSLELLVKIDSPSTDASVKEIVAHLKKQNVISTDLWMGMYDITPPLMKYTWADCSELGNWSNWHPGEPNYLHSEICIRYALSATWKTRGCSRLYHFICERQLDSCWFDTAIGARLVGLVTTFINSTLESCQSLCLNHNGSGEECTAVTSFHNGSCIMAFGDKTYILNYPAIESDATATTSIKRCIAYYVTDVSTEYTDTNNLPNTTCATPSTPLPTAHRGISFTLPDCPTNSTGLSQTFEGIDTDTLILDKTTLSSYRRGLVSVYEGRISAVALGSAGVGIICAVLGVIVCSDLGKMARTVLDVARGRPVNRVYPKSKEKKRTR